MSMVALVLSAVLSHGAAVTPIDPSAKVQPNVELKLTAKGKSEVVVDVVNRGTLPVTLVHPGDGSEAGWRTPIVTWTYEPLDDKARVAAAREPQDLRCGMMNMLTLDEVFTLKPGAKKRLKDWTNLRLPGDGTWKVTLRYQNEPDHLWKNSELPDGPAARAVRASTAVDVTSNAVTLTLSGSGR